MIQSNLMLSRHFIKINACFIGYGIWILFSQNQIIFHSIQVPLFFYKTDNKEIITAPDSVIMNISASRKILQKFDVYNSAMHLDASTLDIGDNHVMLIKENLLLPDEVNLVNLIPSYVQIQLQKVE